jgi:hypothetical protein
LGPFFPLFRKIEESGLAFPELTLVQKSFFFKLDEFLDLIA